MATLVVYVLDRSTPLTELARVGVMAKYTIKNCQSLEAFVRRLEQDQPMPHGVWLEDQHYTGNNPILVPRDKNLAIELHASDFDAFDLEPRTGDNQYDPDSETDRFPAANMMLLALHDIYYAYRVVVFRLP